MARRSCCCTVGPMTCGRGAASHRRLHAAGWRTVTPYLRGFGPTRFRSGRLIRDGRGVALAQDAIDLADALGLETFAVAGHDWGARTAYFLAALFPERVTRIAALSVAVFAARRRSARRRSRKRGSIGINGS